MLYGIPIADLTAPSLLGIVVLLVLFGRIVPRSTLKDKAEESEKWRLAYEAERTARTLSDAQTTELLEVAKTTHKVVETLFSEYQRRSGEANVVIPTPTSSQ